MKHKCIVGTILLLLAFSSVAENIKGDANSDGRVSVADIAIIVSHIMGDDAINIDVVQADVNGDGRVSVADISALVNLIMSGDIVYGEGDTKKDTVYIKYNGSNVSFIGDELTDVQITHDKADVLVTIGENPNIILCLSGKSDDGRISIKADTLFTLQLAGIELTSSHAPAINSYGKQKVNVELVNGTKNCLRDSKTYTFSSAEEVANGCFSVQGALSFSGNGELTLYGKSKHAIYAKKSITFKTGTYNVLEAASDAIHSGKSVTIEGGVFMLSGMKSEAIELDNDFTMKEGSMEMNVTGAGAKGIQCGGDLCISGGIIHAEASGALKNKDGDLSYCSIIKCDGNATITNGEFHMKNNSPGGKCISVDNNLIISGGNFNLKTHGDGGAYTNTANETDYYTSRCLHSKGNITITQCKMECISTGLGGKGIDCSKELTIGTYMSDLNDLVDITITTTGTSVVNDVDEDKRFGCPKAFKSDDQLNILGGTIRVTTKGMGGEGFESKNEIWIVDGNIMCDTFDDCFNGGALIHVYGGNIYCYSHDNDGFDSNGSIVIEGGNIFSASLHPVNESFDTEGNTLTIKGGNIIGIGGSEVRPERSLIPFYCYKFWDNQLVQQPTPIISLSTGNYLSVIRENQCLLSAQIPADFSKAIVTIASPLLNSRGEYVVAETDKIQDGNGFCNNLFVIGGRTANSANEKFIFTPEYY